MISSLPIEKVIYYSKIISALGMVFTGAYTLNSWAYGGETLFYLPLWFYPFVLFSALFSLSNLAK